MLELKPLRAATDPPGLITKEANASPVKIPTVPHFTPPEIFSKLLQ